MNQGVPGDGPLFEECIGQYLPRLGKLARRLCRAGGVDAEDLVQDTLERALQNLERLRARSGSAREAWLCTTLKNRFLDHCRRQRTEFHALVSAPESRSWKQWEHVTDEELREAIHGLAQPLRAAFELYAAGVRYKAIARQLDASVGTVGYWLHEARRRLKAVLHPLVLEREEALEARAATLVCLALPPR